MAAVHAMVPGRKHMWSHSFAGAEDPQICVQAGCTRAKAASWLSLHIFSLVHRHLPCKSWDVLGAASFFFVSGQPSRLLFGYLPLTMLLLRAFNACLSFLLLILLGCRQICPICFFFLCFASLWLTVLPLLVDAQLWSPVASLVLFVLLHARLLFLNLCSSASLLHASGVLLIFPVSVVSVLILSFGFAFCPVAVYLMILCSCRPL
jgi:hypothetical protein